MQSTDYYSSNEYKKAAKNSSNKNDEAAFKSYGPRLDENNLIHNYNPYNVFDNVHPYFEEKMESLFSKAMSAHGSPPIVVGRFDFTGIVVYLIIIVICLILLFTVPLAIESDSYKAYVKIGLWGVITYSGLFIVSALFESTGLYETFLRIFHKDHMKNQKKNNVKDYNGFIDIMGKYLGKVESCSDKIVNVFK